MNEQIKIDLSERKISIKSYSDKLDLLRRSL